MMEKGSCIINGTDLADLGIFILKGGDNDLLPFPQRTIPTQNDWFEYDGIDADLSEVYFKEKTVDIKFYISARSAGDYITRLKDFITLLTSSGDDGYLYLYSREFDRTFKLRYVVCSSYEHEGGLYKPGIKAGEINIRFSMDNPLQLLGDETIIRPNAYGVSKTFVTLNGLDFSQFGIIVNQCYNSVLEPNALKEPLIRTFDKHTGLEVYPSTIPHLKNKEVVVNCTMLADSREEFYHNYQALFNNLRQTGTIELSTLYEDTDCYYSSMQNFKKTGAFCGGVKVTFDLLFTAVTPNVASILATENIVPVITEDNLHYILLYPIKLLK